MRKILLLGHGDLLLGIAECLKEHYEICGVITHEQTDIAKYAQDNNIPLLITKKFNEETVKWVNKLNPALQISVSCRTIIPKSYLKNFTDQVINIHCTDLPNYRGGASHSWLLLNDSKRSGVTWHFIDKGIDTGPIISQIPFNIDDCETPEEIMRRAWSIAEPNTLRVVNKLLNHHPNLN